jgi:hypothetical protein
LEHLHLVVWLSTPGVDAGDPPLPGIVDTGVGDQQAIGLLDPYGVIVDEDVHGLPPEALIHREAEVVQPDVTIGAYHARAVPEPEGALQATRFDRSPVGTAQYHLR